MDRTNEVQLEPLEKQEREEFITQVQQAFDKGAQDVFGKDIPPAIPRKDVEESLDDPKCKAYHILCQGKVVGGAVVRWEEAERRCGLELLFIRPEIHGRGLGQSAWQAGGWLMVREFCVTAPLVIPVTILFRAVARKVRRSYS